MRLWTSKDLVEILWGKKKPRRGPLKEPNQQRPTHLSEVIVVDLHAVLGKVLRKMDGRTGEVIVADHVADHLLIQVAVVDVIPIGVLIRYIPPG